MMGWLDTDNGGVAVRVLLAGPSTTSQLPELLEAARQAVTADCDVEVDCRSVGELGLGALQILAALARELTQRERALRIVRAGAALAAAIELAGFSGVLDIEGAR